VAGVAGLLRTRTGSAFAAGVGDGFAFGSGVAVGVGDALRRWSLLAIASGPESRGMDGV
jgi:hypothetical protein